MKRIAALLTAALLLATPAAASAQSARDEPDPKNPTAALALSLGVTAAGYATVYIMNDRDAGSPGLGYLSAAAITLGPTVGHWYAGETFTRGLGFRVGGAATVVTGMVVLLRSCPIFGDHCDDSPGGAALLAVGAVAFAYGTMDDIFTAPSAARRYNQRARARRSLSVAPRITDKDAGLVVAGTF